MTTKLMKGLNDRQKAFCYEYLKCGCNGTKAAIAAGYSKKTATVAAHENLTKPHIRTAINQLLEVKGYTPEFCKTKLGSYATADISDFEPWLRGLGTLSDLQGVGVDTSVLKSASITEGKLGETRKLVLHDGQKATETLAKMHALFSEKGDAGEEARPGLEVTRRIVIEEYKQHAGDPVDLGVAGLQPLPRRIFDAGDNGGRADGDNGPDV